MSRKSTSTKTTTKKSSSSAAEQDYSSMKVTELKKLCISRGLSAAGLKAEIVKRLQKGAVPAKKPAKKETAKKVKEEPVRKGRSKKVVSESEENSEEREESEVKEKKKSKTVAKKTTKKPAKKEVKPKKGKKVTKKVVSEESDSNEERDEVKESSGSDESEEEKPKKGKVKKISSEDDDSNEERDEKEDSNEERDEVEEELSDSDEESEEREEVKPKKSKAKEVVEESVPSEDEKESSSDSNEGREEDSNEGRDNKEKEEEVQSEESEDEIISKIDHYEITPAQLTIVLRKLKIKSELFFKEVAKFGVENQKELIIKKSEETPKVKGTQKVKEPEKPSVEVRWDENAEVFRFQDYVFNNGADGAGVPEAIGYCVGVDNKNKPYFKRLRSEQTKFLKENKIRYVKLKRQEELDEILEKIRASRKNTDKEELPEGEDDGVEVTSGAPEDAMEEVEVGLKEITTGPAPEITEEKFRKFVVAQNANKNKADYVQIAKEAGLTDLEGQQIMTSYKFLNDKYPTVAANVFVRKVPAKALFGAKESTTVPPKSGRKLIKK